MNEARRVPALWRNICRAAGIEPTARGALDSLHQLLQDTIGRGTLQRIQAGTEPQYRSLLKIAAALHVDVADLTASDTFAREPRALYGSEALAHTLSHLAPTLDPPTIAWEGLVEFKIEGRFMLAVHGDALMPRFWPGQMAIWEAGNTAQAGQAVLVRDGAGDFHMRIYEPHPDGAWAGISTQPGHRTIRSNEPGATLLARLRFLDLG